ncbi:MAG: homoserine dehydrogenase [Candidatus Omnitrophica bacterium]|nr:homoserine dehydrogenase [Candidatus Omnitrophota bacterium]
MNKNIGIIGLGNVGEAVVESLNRYSALISRRSSLELKIKKVCDISRGKKVIADKFRLPFTCDPYEIIDDPQIDIIVELIGGIEPARTIILKALDRRKNVVTANKALLATSGKHIFSVAQKRKRRVGFEASVCGAIPLIKSTSEGLVGCEVSKIYGILNGTTNYILYKMRQENIDFSCALKEVQERGLAEKKPDLDIKGIDTLHKLCILTYLYYGLWPDLKAIHTEGISKISLLDIQYAQELEYRIKLLAIAKKGKSSLELRVHPTLVSVEHPLSHVSLNYNAVYYHTQPAGELLFFGEGAGGKPTSASIISDIVSIASGNKGFVRNAEKVRLKDFKNVETRFYIRCLALDSPGVLAEVSKILASYDISIASVNQKERKEGKFVPIVMLSHKVKEDNMEKALKKIDSLKVIKRPSQIIRIEDL